MQGRMYYIPFIGLSVTNDSDQDIWEIVNSANFTLRLHQYWLESAYTTDERVNLRLVRRSTTGSGGSGVTEVRAAPGDAAHGFSVNQLVTTPGTIGDILPGHQWGQLARLEFLAPPAGWIVIPPSGRLCLNLNGTTLGGTRTWSGGALVEELG